MDPSAEPRLKALMLESLKGDPQAYRTLLGEVTTRVRIFYSRRLANDGAAVEDLVQDVLIAIHKSRDSYDPGSPFTAWVYALARYKLTDHFRRTGRRGEVGLDDVDEGLFATESEAEDARRDVARLLQTLPAQQRDLVRGVKIEGLSIAEAAAKAGISEAAAKVSIHRSLKRLSAKVQT